MLKFCSLFILTAILFWGCVSIGFGDEATCGGEKYVSVSQICENNVLKVPCGGKYHNPATQFCNGNDVFDKCDGKVYEPEIYKCEENILFSKCGGEGYNTLLNSCIDNVIVDKEFEFIDNRDGKNYKGVIIGAQTWMAENLRYETSKFKCYNDNLYNCDFFGMMYDWETALEVCPEGWHLPNDAEWNILESFTGSNASTKLRANSEFWIGKNGTDDFGFSALPGGFYRGMNGVTFNQKGVLSGFWSSTAGSSSGSAHFRYLANDRETLGLDGLYTNNAWANVRCIRDN